MTDDLRWKVRKQPDGMWRIFNSLGEWDSDYADWSAAIAWAANPFRRAEYYSNNPNGV